MGSEVSAPKSGDADANGQCGEKKQAQAEAGKPEKMTPCESGSGRSAGSAQKQGKRSKRKLGNATSCDEHLDVVVEEEKSYSDLNSVDSSLSSSAQAAAEQHTTPAEASIATAEDRLNHAASRDFGEGAEFAHAPESTGQSSTKAPPPSPLLHEPPHQQGPGPETAMLNSHEEHEDEYGTVYKSNTVRLGESLSLSDHNGTDYSMANGGGGTTMHFDGSQPLPPMTYLDGRDSAPLSSPPQSVENPPMPLTWEDGDRDDSSQRASKKLMIGDKYEVISLIGRGAQGTVIKCRHVETQEFVAIKTIKGGSLVVGTTAMPRQVGRRRRKGGSGMNSVMKQVSREIALLKKVNHPNIVRLLEVVDVTTDRDIHLVFEYVSGGPLRQLSDQLLLKNSGVPLPEDEAREYFRQLLLAVRYLHHHGIMHRDIKPSNLIIDRVKRRLKLTDLGIATQTRQGKEHRILGIDDNLVATALVVGTPAFLPPEFYRIKVNEEALQERLLRDLDDQADAAATQETAIGLPRENSVLEPRPEQFIPGRAADIWAMGVTLYSFIYGGLPFTQRRRQSRGSFSQQIRKFPTFSSGGSTSSVEREGAYSSGERDESRAGDGGGNGSRDDRSGSALDLVVSPLRRKRSSRAPLTQDEMQHRILENPLRFPGTGLGTSMRLRVLLQRMLDKDPRTRATMDEICQHDWVSKYEPLPALSHEQLSSIEPSKRDQEHAITNYSSMLVRMQRAFRGMRSRAHIFGSGIRSSEHSFSQSIDSGGTGSASNDDLEDFLQN
ncbi:Serine/threonine-protein kinase ssp1 [Hondaea fermentalgiana]|uniref:Serine/threonine-protein kinase ssp1 n=1 Tax=Hondaea fermentalgiana TaxID=2315210 RepID=A0A2R5GHU9_9STRA|nr:Serine/threonine-protein kinase ssp1 [Hondaea fermentalgiana]|eukprot:GBG30165.1 Serine/threonine-protein kinase ssp1 [Hondaea fermentalgiana]